MQRLFGRRYRSFESRNRVIYAAVSFVPAHFLGVGASVLALCRRLQERCSIYPVRFERHSGYVRSICAAQYSQRRQKENAVVNILRCIPDSSHPLRSGVPGDHFRGRYENAYHTISRNRPLGARVPRFLSQQSRRLVN